MKKKLFDRRGAAIELAMLMIVVCFSLSILILSTSMLLHNKRIRSERRMEQSGRGRAGGRRLVACRG